MTHRQLFDVGLQPERTELAWRRTSLSVATASLASLRVLPALLGSPLWALFGIAGVILAICLWTAARSRYLHFNATTGTPPTAARQLLAVAIFTSTAGILGLTAILHAAR